MERKSSMHRVRWAWRATGRSQYLAICGLLGLSLAALGFVSHQLLAQDATDQAPIRVAQVKRVIRGRIFAGPAAQAGDRPQSVDGVFLPVDRETSATLEKAKELLQQERFADAIPLLDGVLGQADDFFFKPDPQQAIHKSLKAEARRLLSEMPEEGWKSYELQYGASARQALDDALASGDTSKLALVVRRYLLTRAGQEAAFLLGRHYWDHGQSLAAALLLERLQALPRGKEEMEPALSIMLATCWLQAGQADKAQAVLAALKKVNQNARPRLGGKPTDLFATDQDSIQWLAARLGSTRPGFEQQIDQWALPGGNPARNAVSGGGSPILNHLWRQRTSMDEGQEEEAAKQRRQLVDAGQPPIPAGQPLAVGKWVLLRSTDGVVGIDFETGKRVWQRRDGGGASVAAGDGGMGSSTSEQIWENATRGTLSSDGELVFVVDEIPVAGTPNYTINRRQMQVMMMNGQSVQPMRSYNLLAAHELRTEGKLRWEVGGAESENEPQLAEAYFLGPPLPMQGALYALAEQKGEIKLVVLDAKTGKLLWSQQLAVVEQSVAQDWGRRVLGLSPSFADGVLVCPTGAGAAVAIDLSSRSLLWGYQFPRSPQHEQAVQMRMNMGWNGQMVMPSPPGTNWLDANPIVINGRVLITARESDQLHCLSLLDGKVLWSQPRGESLFVAPIGKDQALVIGRSQIQAIKLADGQPGWTAPLVFPAGHAPSGRGFASEGNYYLPLTSAEVIKIDTVSGTIKARSRSRNGVIPGNLISYQGYVVSQGVDSIDKFFQREPLKKLAEAQLAKDPSNATALAWRGEIALDDGQPSAAAADLRQAAKAFQATWERLQKDPQTAASAAKKQELSSAEGDLLRTRGLLFDSLVMLLDADFKGNREALSELEALVEMPDERARYLAVAAAGYQQQGQVELALAAYLKLADLDQDRAEEPTIEQSDRSVRRDRWIQARLSDLLSAAKPEGRAAIDREAESRLRGAAAAESNREAAIRRFLSYFGFHRSAEEARELLVLQLGDDDTVLEREQLLLSLEQSADAPRRAAAVARLGLLYEGANRPNEAASCYRRLAREFADVVCLDGKTGKQLVEAMSPDQPARIAMQVSTAWPYGEVKAEPAQSRASRANQYQQFFNVDLRGERSLAGGNSRVLFDSQLFQLMGRDSLGKERFRLSLGQTAGNRGYGYQPGMMYGVGRGHFLAVSMGSQVVAVDTLRSAERRLLWNFEQLDQAQLQMQMMGFGGGFTTRTVANPWGPARMVFTSANNQPMPSLGTAVASGVCVQRGRDLMLLDMLSGKPVWTRRGVEPGSELFGDDEVLIVAPPNGEQAQLIRTLDGELLGTRAVPPANLRWTSSGRKLLAWKEEKGKLRLYLLDVPAGTEQTLGEFSLGSKGTIVDGEQVAVYDAMGKFSVFSLRDGAKAIESSVEPDPSLYAIIVQRTADQYLLITSRPRQARASSGVNYQPAIQDNSTGTNSPLISGRVYAFDRTTGAPSWQVPALIDQHGWVPFQGSDLPVLVFVRHVFDRESNRRGATPASVLCLDKRTGRAVYQNDRMNGPANSFEAVGDLESKSVTLQLFNHSIALKFTDLPTPPEPPYQAGLDTARDRVLSKSKFGGVLRAFGRAAEEVVPVPAEADPFERR